MTGPPKTLTAMLASMELLLAGIAVAVAAPASDLATVMKDDIGSPIGRILTAYALQSWSEVYGAPLGSIVQASDLPAMAAVSGACAEGLGEALVLSYDASPLRHGLSSMTVAGFARPWCGEDSAAFVPLFFVFARLFVCDLRRRGKKRSGIWRLGSRITGGYFWGWSRGKIFGKGLLCRRDGGRQRLVGRSACSYGWN